MLPRYQTMIESYGRRTARAATQPSDPPPACRGAHPHPSPVHPAVSDKVNARPSRAPRWRPTSGQQGIDASPGHATRSRGPCGRTGGQSTACAYGPALCRSWISRPVQGSAQEGVVPQISGSPSALRTASSTWIATLPITRPAFSVSLSTATDRTCSQQK